MKSTQIFPLLTGLVIAINLVGCDIMQSEAAIAPLPRPVKLIEVGDSLQNRAHIYPAVIEAADRTELSFQVGGQIQELPIKEGDLVTEGTLIAQLDQRDFINQVVSSRAQFENAEEEYQRALRLASEDAIAQSVLEQRKSQRDIAKAQLDTAEKALNDTSIRAPFDGQIANLNYRRLQSIKSGETLAVFISSHDLEAKIDIPSSAIAGISRAALERRKDVSARLTLEALPGMEFEARFKEAEAIADSLSQTYEVSFLFERPEDVLVLPGMNASLEISDFPTLSNGANPNGLSVPLTAVFGSDTQHYVWVYDADSMSVTQRPIELAEGVGDQLLVSSGLRAGEKVVAAGTSYLSEGMNVRPWDK